MARLPVVTAKVTIRRLQRAGYSVDSIEGSHYTLRSVDGKRRVTVPFHRGDLKRKTLKSILQQAGLTIEEFIDL